MGDYVLPAWEAQLFQYLNWVINTLIVSASLIFYYKFLKLRERTTGHYMIFVLTLSDLIFPAMNMLTTTILKGKVPDDILYIIAVAVYRFSLYWSTAIAIFSYMILAQSQIINSRSFFIKAFFSCFILTFFCPSLIIYNVFGIDIKHLGPGFSTVGFPPSSFLTQILGWLTFDIVGTTVPALIIFICYFKVYQTLKTSYDSIIEQTRITAGRMFIYVIIPFLCFMPWTLADLYNILIGIDYPFSVVILASTLRRCWGFLNLLAYWFLSPGYHGRTSSSATSESLIDSTLELKRTMTL